MKQIKETHLVQVFPADQIRLSWSHAASQCLNTD